MSENKNINQEIIEEEYMLGKEYYSKILILLLFLKSFIPLIQ